MSEEEIIKDVKDFNNITVLYGQLVLLKSQLTRYQKASNNLLDLYNKEKEQNSLIKNKLKELNIPMETLIGEFNRLEDLEDDREQLKWRLKEEKENYDKLTKHFIENHISKDKIRAKIEKLNKRIKNLKQIQDSCVKSIRIEDCQEKIELYRELLEEN